MRDPLFPPEVMAQRAMDVVALGPRVSQSGGVPLRLNSPSKSHMEPHRGAFGRHFFCQFCLGVDLLSRPSERGHVRGFNSTAMPFFLSYWPLEVSSVPGLGSSPSSLIALSSPATMS